MASHVFTDGYVLINAVDLSDRVKSATLNYSARMEDDASMGDDTEVAIAGPKAWSVSVAFKQDYAAGKVDATLFSLVGALKFAIALRADAAAKAVDNPEFGGNVVLETYPPITGAWGGLHQTTAEFKSAGTLTRSTA